MEVVDLNLEHIDAVLDTNASYHDNNVPPGHRLASSNNISHRRKRNGTIKDNERQMALKTFPVAPADAP
jgi:hypothetical protein